MAFICFDSILVINTMKMTFNQITAENRMDAGSCCSHTPKHVHNLCFAGTAKQQRGRSVVWCQDLKFISDCSYSRVWHLSVKRIIYVLSNMTPITNRIYMYSTFFCHTTHRLVDGILPTEAWRGLLGCHMSGTWLVRNLVSCEFYRYI